MLSRPKCLIPAGRIMSKKHSNDTTIGDRNRDSPASNTLNQPIMSLRAACYYVITNIFPYLNNHSVYLQNSAAGVFVCLPLKISAAANVLTLHFIANNSNSDGRSIVKNSAVHVEDNHILTGIPDKCDSHEALLCASLLRPLWSK